jgi:hypothetical protein
MRIYVSSTFRDLEEHRRACIRVLRQLGHEVVSMEDYVAESSIPVEKVVADVKSCDLYVILVAWRYGYIPDKERVNIDVEGAVKGETSITEYEFLTAVAAKVKRLAFLIHEHAPWPPHLMDGFGSNQGKRGDVTKVLEFREKIQRDLMVAYFEEPSDLEARLSAAVASVGLRSQMLKNSVTLHEGSINTMAASIPITDSGRMPLDMLVTANPSPEVAVIDIGMTWWSTRLYLLAVVADKLTDVKRVVINEGNEFIGIVSPIYIRETLRTVHPEVEQFENKSVGLALPLDGATALSHLLEQWNEVILPINTQGASVNDPYSRQNEILMKEQAIQLTLNRTVLLRLLGDGFLTGAVRVVDPDQTTVLDLLRVLDYPNQYVPVVAEPGSRTAGKTPLRIINKATLNEQLARNYIDDTLTSLGLRFRN